jgi:CheY-like chemotaxis protein
MLTITTDDAWSLLSEFAADPTTRPARLRVLAVDDDPAILHLLVTVLDRFHVTVASGGPQALEMLAGGLDVDIAIVDVMMPDMDGLELLGHLQADRPDLPVVMLTALTDLTTQQRAETAGAVCFITKPFDPLLLEASLELVVADSEAAPDL